MTRGGEMRTFNVQVTQQRAEGKIEGLVVTLDDITDLMAAERRSAWADVARRIVEQQSLLEPKPDSPAAP